METRKWHIETLPVTGQPVIRDKSGNLVAGGVTTENAPLIATAPSLCRVCEALLAEVKVHTTKGDLGMQRLIRRTEQVLSKTR